MIKAEDPKQHNDMDNGTCSGCLVAAVHGPEGWEVTDAGSWDVLPENGCDCKNPLCPVKMGQVQVAVVRVHHKRKNVDGAVEVQYLPQGGSRVSKILMLC